MTPYITYNPSFGDDSQTSVSIFDKTLTLTILENIQNNRHMYKPRSIDL